MAFLLELTFSLSFSHLLTSSRVRLTSKKTFFIIHCYFFLSFFQFLVCDDSRFFSNLVRFNQKSFLATQSKTSTREKRMLLASCPFKDSILGARSLSSRLESIALPEKRSQSFLCYFSFSLRLISFRVR